MLGISQNWNDMTKIERYDPYTRLTILEKTRLVDFLQSNLENGHFTPAEIMETLECAVKERPSFGGFVLALLENERLLGAIVVNRTGMEAVDTQHRLSLLGVARSHRHNGVAKKLIAQAMIQTGNGLALQLEPSDGEMAYFEELGFEKKYVVMRAR